MDYCITEGQYCITSINLLEELDLTLFQAELDALQELYSFKLTSVNNQPYFYIKFDNGEERNLKPEDIGAGSYLSN